MFLDDFRVRKNSVYVKQLYRLQAKIGEKQNKDLKGSNRIKSKIQIHGNNTTKEKKITSARISDLIEIQLKQLIKQKFHIKYDSDYIDVCFNLTLVCVHNKPNYRAAGWLSR